jgi:hypothetical protein
VLSPDVIKALYLILNFVNAPPDSDLDLLGDISKRPVDVSTVRCSSHSSAGGQLALCDPTFCGGHR